MFSRKDRFLHHETKKLVLHFSDFLRFLMIFRSCCCNPKTTFTAGSLEFYKNLPVKISILAMCPLPAQGSPPAAGTGRRCTGEQPARPRGPTRRWWWCPPSRSRRRRAPSAARRGGVRRDAALRRLGPRCAAAVRAGDAGRLEEGGKAGRC
jgi:hypothetical protein